MRCSSSFQSQGFNLWRLILSDSGVLTAATQLFLLNSIARRQRTAPSWAAAGERLFTTRASISISYTGGGLIPRTVALSVRRACIGSATTTLTAAPQESWTVTNYYKQAIYDPKESKIGDIDD